MVECGPTHCSLVFVRRVCTEIMPQAQADNRKLHTRPPTSPIHHSLIAVRLRSVRNGFWLWRSLSFGHAHIINGMLGLSNGSTPVSSTRVSAHPRWVLMVSLTPAPMSYDLIDCIRHRRMDATNVRKAGCKRSINMAGWMSALGRPRSGAETILSGCCTASDVHNEPISEFGKWLSTLPIILRFKIRLVRCILKLRFFNESNPRK